jgi:hypothetical protein
MEMHGCGPINNRYNGLAFFESNQVGLRLRGNVQGVFPALIFSHLIGK